jgi:hypothetical protein
MNTAIRSSDPAPSTLRLSALPSSPKRNPSGVGPTRTVRRPSFGEFAILGLICVGLMAMWGGIAYLVGDFILPSESLALIYGCGAFVTAVGLLCVWVTMTAREL